MTRQYKWQLRQKAKGCCVICAVPVRDKTMCDRHRKIYNAHDRDYYHEQRRSK